MRSSSLATALLVGLVAGASHSEEPTALDGYERFVRPDGTFRFSADATEDLTHLGSWFVPEGDAAGFHHVYTQPEAIAAYRQTGAFPDGTALVKEIVRHRRGDYTTGHDVASATEVAQWFLMVKDARGRFPGNALWGDGWGWALFAGDAPTENTARDYRTDCLGCHAPAKAHDWVYVEGYPRLDRPR